MGRFIVVPEPHISSTNIEGRQDYLTEIKVYMNMLKKIVQEDEEIKWVVFAGDIFNRGFKDIGEYLYWIDWFTDMDSLLVSRGGCIYSAVGNHEINFSKLNPFWRMISSDDGGYDTTAQWVTKSIKPIGLRSLIHVTDVIDFGNVILFLCHYDAVQECAKYVDMYSDRRSVKVCVSHLPIISNEIERVLISNHGRDPLTSNIKYEQIRSMNFLYNFDYVFNGHMHKAYSRFILKDESNGHETKLQYLGSLGRTNSEEINDNDLVRIFPIIDVDTGEMLYEDIKLLDRSSSLISNYDYEKRELHYEKEEYSEICSKLEDIESPIQSIKDSLTRRDMVNALECAVSGVLPIEFEELYKRQGLLYNGRT